MSDPEPAASAANDPEVFVTSRRVGRWRAGLERRVEGYKLPITVDLSEPEPEPAARQRRGARRGEDAAAPEEDETILEGDATRRPVPGERPPIEPAPPPSQVEVVVPTTPLRPIVRRPADRPAKKPPPESGPVTPPWVTPTPPLPPPPVEPVEPEPAAPEPEDAGPDENGEGGDGGAS